ncbi:YcxB family protein [uncultured Oscillibacter sp.]|uniref:YcxB family protein n=1 Tax=uncultured Oscillibacter sp. TaxID=876091 RepID=UPI00262FE66A|nr:YcxB family protein [uncultured Oscillibacter sp.]
MEFVFRVSNYDAPELEFETAELLRRRLEARSRQVMPGMWKVTDKLNAHAAKGPGIGKRRYRVYGVILIALGIFALVPGLMEPRIPSLIVTGGFAALMGVWCLCLRERRPLQPPASCRREAAALLKARRETDWDALRAEVRFDEAGWFVKTAEGESRTAYEDLRSVFETERLWLLVGGTEQALLLQKKDLVSGEAGDFLPYLQGKIINQSLPHKGEST